MEKVVSTLQLLKDKPERWDKEWKLSGVDVDESGNVNFHYHTYDTPFLHLMLKRFIEIKNLKQIDLIQAELKARNN
jgi:hypothetical protein